MRAQAKVALGDLAPWKKHGLRVRPGSGPARQNGMVLPAKNDQQMWTLPSKNVNCTNNNGSLCGKNEGVQQEECGCYH